MEIRQFWRKFWDKLLKSRKLHFWGFGLLISIKTLLSIDYEYLKDCVGLDSFFSSSSSQGCCLKRLKRHESWNKLVEQFVAVFSHATWIAGKRSWYKSCFSNLDCWIDFCFGSPIGNRMSENWSIFGRTDCSYKMTRFFAIAPMYAIA